MNPKISVIIPVYNTGSALKYCINSLLEQDFKNIEILLVNDGSTDTETLAICSRFCKKDTRLKMFNKQNEGIEKTRIFGIEKASGKYILFSDHDDWYTHGALSLLISQIENTHSDIIVANYYEVLHPWFPLRFKGHSVKKGETLSNREFIDQYYINFFGVNIFNVSTWGKLYKADLLKNYQFKLLGHDTIEDVVFNMQIFPLAKKITFITDFVYFHRRGGLTSIPNTAKLLKTYEDLYYMKKEYINLYHLEKAVPFINYEMKNILKHYVNLSVQNDVSFENIFTALDAFIDTKAFISLGEFYNNSNTEDEFMQNFLSGNYKKIYRYAVNENKKITVKKIIKNFLK